LRQSAAIGVPLSSGWFEDFDFGFNMFGNVIIESGDEVVVDELSRLVIGEGITVSSSESGVAQLSASPQEIGFQTDFAFDEGNITIGSGESYPIGKFVVPPDAAIVINSGGVMGSNFDAPSNVSLRYWNDSEKTTIHEFTTPWNQAGKKITGHGGDNIIVELVNSSDTTHILSGSTNGGFE